MTGRSKRPGPRSSPQRSDELGPPTRLLDDDLAAERRGDVDGFLAVLGWVFEKTNGQIELDTKLCLGTDGWAAELERAQLGRHGETVESDNAFVYRFEGDRIAEIWMYVGLMPEVAEAFFG